MNDKEDKITRRRLLVLTSTYPRWVDDPEPGFVHELSKRLGANLDVTVLCPHASGAKRIDTMDGVRINRFRYAPERFETLVQSGGIMANLSKTPWKLLLVPLFLMAQLLSTIRLFHQIKPDVVHAHWLIPQGFVVSLVKLFFLRNVPVVITSHGADLFALRSSVFRTIKKWVLKRANVVTVVSQSMKDEVCQLLGSGENVFVMPMGVDLDVRFTPSVKIDRDPSKLLFVGRLVEKKGLKVLINSLPAVLKSCPEVTLDVVGFGPAMAELKELTHKLGLDEKIQFVGAVSQSDLPNHYRRCGIFVAPFITAKSGDEEGLGLVVVEALGCGCRAVVSDMKATRDIVECVDGVLSVEQKNPEALANAITQSVKDQNVEEPDRRASLDRFGWNSVSNSYQDLLNRLGRGTYEAEK
jgi:glycosyltransferase involved in cell wall biosynthesis